MWKHIIWDWNGTLLDDNWLSVEAMNVLLARRQLPLLTLDKYVKVFTFPVSDYYQCLGFDFHKEPFTISGTEFIEEYNKRAFEPKLHHSIRETILRLKEKGVSHSILSASRQEILDRLVGYHKLTSLFIGIVGQEDHYARGKTAAGKTWLEKLPYEPWEILFVGDTIHDREVAKALGVDCALVACGHNSYERLRDQGCPVFKDIAALQMWLYRLAEKD
jgi:phosphoglycolate phosphatase